MVVVLDPGLLSIVNVTSGLKEGGVLIINTKKSIDEMAARFGNKWKIATVNATKIAREELGVPIVNTTMLGALVRATGVVKPESLVEPLKHRFERLADRNIKAMTRAYETTLVKEYAQVG